MVLSEAKSDIFVKWMRWGSAKAGKEVALSLGGVRWEVRREK